MRLLKCDACGFTEQEKPKMARAWREDKFLRDDDWPPVHLCGQLECIAWWYRDFAALIPAERPKYEPEAVAQ